MQISNWHLPRHPACLPGCLPGNKTLKFSFLPGLSCAHRQFWAQLRWGRFFTIHGFPKLCTYFFNHIRVKSLTVHVMLFSYFHTGGLCLGQNSSVIVRKGLILYSLIHNTHDVFIKRLGKASQLSPLLDQPGQMVKSNQFLKILPCFLWLLFSRRTKLLHIVKWLKIDFLLFQWPKSATCNYVKAIYM